VLLSAVAGFSAAVFDTLLAATECRFTYRFGRFVQLHATTKDFGTMRKASEEGK
jgi:hypothetical protein